MQLIVYHSIYIYIHNQTFRPVPQSYIVSFLHVSMKLSRVKRCIVPTLVMLFSMVLLDSASTRGEEVEEIGKFDLFSVIIIVIYEEIMRENVTVQRTRESLIT